MSEKVIYLNSVLNDTLQYLDDNRDSIVDIICLVETASGVIRYFNTTKDTDFLYLAKRKVCEDLDYMSITLYEDADTFNFDIEQE